MSSARIDLSSRSAVCSLGGIDRTKPAILAPYMSQPMWDQFCNEIDDVLRPVHFWSKVAMACFGATFLTFLVVIIIQIVSVTTSDPFGGDNPFDDDFFGDNNSGPGVPILFLIPFGSVIIGMTGMCFFAYKASQASLEIEKVCKKTSEQQPHLSFHVRYDRHFYHSSGFSSGGHHHHHGSHTSSSVDQYIEVSIDSSTTAVPVTITNPYTTTSATLPSYTSNQGTSAAERLADLEKARAYMTDQEYERKRADILASM